MVAHKHYRLDPRKIRRAKKLMGASTETETIDRALDESIAERERNRACWEALNRFVKSGIPIRDVYGKLEG